MSDDKYDCTKTKTVGNIVTQADPPKPLPKVDRDTIGTGTADFVPGHTTRLSTPISQIKKQ